MAMASPTDPQRVNFARVNQAALNAYPGLLNALLPGGSAQGREFICGDLSGKPGRSLSVNLEKGVWKDFSTGEAGSDPVSLWASVHNCSQVEAARMLAAQLGLPGAGQDTGNAYTPRQATTPALVNPEPVAAASAPERIVHPHFGQPDAVWPYRNAAGLVIGLVCRWNLPGGGKEIRPFTPHRDANGGISWQWKGWSDPRPLYGLDRLASRQDAPVLVCEGEKAADAAQELFPGMVTTTWPHGAESASKADFSPLQGRTIYVWPDADEPGHKAAQAVCAAAMAAGAAGVLVVAPPEGVGAGWDAADALAEGWTPAQAATWLQENSMPHQQEECSATSMFDIEPLDIDWCLRTSPPKKIFHARPYIPAGCVGVLTGTGAVGKSYLTLALCVGVACGHSFGPFEIEQAGRVVVVNVEDQKEDLHFRLVPVVGSMSLSFEEQQLLKQNLCILPARGKLGPLMELDERRNPRTSASYEWLRGEVRKYQPDLLVLDTKSRLFGLDENSNDHAAQWLVALERLLVARPELSILIVSHSSKAAANAGDTSQHSNRGASALVDNGRFTLTLTGVNEEEARKIGGKGVDLVRLVHAKPNYARKAEPALFRRGEKGELHPVDQAQLRGDRFGEVVEQLRAILLEDYPEGIRTRDLERCLTQEAKDLRDWCLDGSGLAAGDWPEIIRFGVESLRLEEVVDATSKSNNKPTLIRAKTAVSTGKSLTGTNWQENMFAS